MEYSVERLSSSLTLSHVVSWLAVRLGRHV
jgi:hypothetical protein